MSAFEVLQRYGTWALLRFVLALLVFLALHLVRLPLLAAARVLEVCMRRVDGLVVAGLPPRPADTATGQTSGTAWTAGPAGPAWASGPAGPVGAGEVWR
jgi:hypothetical protein